MVRAARLVQDAEEVLDGIVTGSSDRRRSGRGGGDDGYGGGHAERIRAEMLDELRHQARCRRTELRHPATTPSFGNTLDGAMKDLSRKAEVDEGAQQGNCSII